MALESREMGNKRFVDGDYDAATAAYTELIMQTRALEKEGDIVWPEDSKKEAFLLRATAYLNLSQCFLKTQQWTHAINTATRAMVGDENPSNPAHDVLPDEKKVKALFRRAQAHRESGSYEKARKDIEEAREKGGAAADLDAELAKIKRAEKGAEKAAKKKLTGFLSGARLGDDEEDARRAKEAAEKALKEANRDPKEIMDNMKQVASGLYVAPGAQPPPPEENPHDIDFEELGAEITRMKVDEPEAFDELKKHIEQHLMSLPKEGEEGDKNAEDGKNSDDDGKNKVEEVAEEGEGATAE
mmetsp:Transcript_16084/g.40910  ORF Transcript_16084/g.40910 Transcript_16084/m.40910 type:complete len:300 (-) Transcript_16084:95-994(-)